MWSRFSEEARRAIVFAQEEAQAAKSAVVDTEHLFWGLVREDTVARRILEKRAWKEEELRKAIERLTPRRPPATGDELTLTCQGRTCIDKAYRVAMNAGDNFIGTEHLLLGVIDEGKGPAARGLVEFGFDRDSLADTWRGFREESGDPISPPSRPWYAFWRPKS